MGTIDQFLHTSLEEILQSLQTYQTHSLQLPIDSSQLTAWRQSHALLTTALKEVYNSLPSVQSWSIIFEYALPRERGRRPDVILLGPSVIFVLEFKEYREIHQAHLDQVDAYARDLKHYHAASHQQDVLPVLVLAKSPSVLTKHEKVWIVSPDNLSALLLQLSPNGDHPLIEAEQWLAAEYHPLPSLIDAARMIYHQEPLPQIRRALSAGIPQTVQELVAIGKRAQDRGELHLALVTGVPGSGKTLVGIQLVYENNLGAGVGEKSAVFLSGNGPLVKVLQHALRNTIFVQDVHGFIQQYGGGRLNLPMEHILVYDEAQRAWDSERAREKRNTSYSEPEDFLRLAERMDRWGFIVALIGEGQEIHIGEERGLPLWREALDEMQKEWTIHCSEGIAPIFQGKHRLETTPRLNLTTTLRSHLAEDLTHWVEELLSGNIAGAGGLATQITAQGFDLYLTRDLSRAQQYVKERYQGQEEKRYGLIASSKAKNLPQYGIQNEYQYTKMVKPGSWYNDPPSSPYSCCALRDVVTEFGCQGLELDFPIMGWGVDLIWADAGWQSKRTRSGRAHDPHQLRLNSYRVLLTRGRDGLIIFVPNEEPMNATYTVLQAAGVRELPVMDRASMIPQNGLSIS